MAGEVEAAVKQAKEAVEKGDNQQILDEIESINKLTSKLIHRDVQDRRSPRRSHSPDPEPAKRRTAESAASEGEVIDAEFEDIGKNKK